MKTNEKEKENDVDYLKREMARMEWLRDYAEGKEWQSRCLEWQKMVIESKDINNG